jgi:hypothetical protein
MPIIRLGNEVRFLVPMVRNTDQELHDVETWEWLKDEMDVVFPEGWQQRHVLRNDKNVSGTVRGRWFDKDKNESVPDDSVEYVVAVATEQMPKIERLLEEVCFQFDQKCVYFTVGGEAMLYFPMSNSSHEPDSEHD